MSLYATERDQRWCPFCETGGHVLTLCGQFIATSHYLFLCFNAPSARRSGQTAGPSRQQCRSAHPMGGGAGKIRPRNDSPRSGVSGSRRAHSKLSRPRGSNYKRYRDQEPSRQCKIGSPGDFMRRPRDSLPLSPPSSSPLNYVVAQASPPNEGGERNTSAFSSN
ncbi:hypothetical protein EVAR_88179_1 [Eumeta japonica]|uniref:Uncharacterized protein n=1 Tax=Eumeta variegata TaxID=151549 RepID=A0A4C1WBE8_EUMVA|nr:hypothetical protein EVAR_88179_1 [Eumeta japonica]